MLKVLPVPEKKIHFQNHEYSQFKRFFDLLLLTPGHKNTTYVVGNMKFQRILLFPMKNSILL